jgi:hypothetical protein
VPVNEANKVARRAGIVPDRTRYIGHPLTPKPIHGYAKGPPSMQAEKTLHTRAAVPMPLAPVAPVWGGPEYLHVAAVETPEPSFVGEREPRSRAVEKRWSDGILRIADCNSVGNRRDLHAISIAHATASLTPFARP